jgi:hypothetical protein
MGGTVYRDLLLSLAWTSRILPHPGGEPEWFAANADALDGISGTGL